MQEIGYPRDGKSEKGRWMVRKAEISNSKGFLPPPRLEGQKERPCYHRPGLGSPGGSWNHGGHWRQREDAVPAGVAA